MNVENKMKSFLVEGKNIKEPVNAIFMKSFILTRSHFGIPGPGDEVRNGF